MDLFLALDSQEMFQKWKKKFFEYRKKYSLIKDWVH
jgi:hypothetical protein